MVNVHKLQYANIGNAFALGMTICLCFGCGSHFEKVDVEALNAGSTIVLTGRIVNKDEIFASGGHYQALTIKPIRCYQGGQTERMLRCDVSVYFNRLRSGSGPLQQLKSKSLSIGDDYVFFMTLDKYESACANYPVYVIQSIFDSRYGCDFQKVMPIQKDAKFMNVRVVRKIQNGDTLTSLCAQIYGSTGLINRVAELNSTECDIVKRGDAGAPQDDTNGTFLVFPEPDFFDESPTCYRRN